MRQLSDVLGTNTKLVVTRTDSLDKSPGKARWAGRASRAKDMGGRTA